MAAVPAAAQDASVPAPIVVRPVMAATPKKYPPPAQEPAVADKQIVSTELGFDKGVGPAVGRVVTYRNKQYEVVEVSATGGGPTFSGNSHFAIAPAGHGLIVGLKSVFPEKIAALPSESDPSFN